LVLGLLAAAVRAFPPVVDLERSLAAVVVDPRLLPLARHAVFLAAEALGVAFQSELVFAPYRMRGRILRRRRGWLRNGCSNERQ
jgi:hypothetical protein